MHYCWSQQLDYVLLVSGLALLVLATTCWRLARHAVTDLHWRALALFAATTGALQWLQAVWFSAHHPLPFWLIPAAVALAHLPLLWLPVARRDQRVRSARAVLLLLGAAVTVTTLRDNHHQLALALQIAVCTPITIFAALSVLHARCTAPAEQRPALHHLAWAMLLLVVAPLLLRSSLLPASTGCLGEADVLLTSMRQRVAELEAVLPRV